MTYTDVPRGTPQATSAGGRTPRDGARDSARDGTGRGTAGSPETRANTGSATSPLRARRRPLLLAVGAILVLVAALASYVAFTNLSASVTVVVASTDIAKGDLIEAADLGTLDIVGGQASNAVLATDAAMLVGRHAAVDLLAGALITTASVQDALPVEAGHSIVGISVSAGQVPSTPLTAGDRVRIVSTPIPQGEPPLEAPPTIEAHVFLTRTDEVTGALVVDVIVPSDVAAELAARAATGRIAIILDAAAE